MTPRPGRLRPAHSTGRRRPGRGLSNCTNPYGLTSAELRAEIRRRVRQGWQLWELARRFGCDCKDNIT